MVDGPCISRPELCVDLHGQTCAVTCAKVSIGVTHPPEVCQWSLPVKTRTNGLDGLVVGLCNNPRHNPGVLRAAKATLTFEVELVQVNSV